MKRFFICLGLGALFFSACNNKPKEEEVNTDSIKLAETLVKYNDATSLNDSLLLLMGDIYAGLDEINQQEGLLASAGVGDNADKRQEIKNNLMAIKERLANNKRMLAELEQKAKQATTDDGQQAKENKILQQTIADLKKHIDGQEKKINDLTAQLSQANEKITVLTNTVEEKNQQINHVTLQKDSAVTRANQAEAATEIAKQETIAVENEANKVFYCLGTNKQLKEYGVLQKKFLGATKIMQGDNINYNCFTQGDKRYMNKIATNAKKVSIKSNMPKDSYMISGTNDGPKTIVITNPAAFWRNTPYLVVELDDVLK